MPGPPAVAKPSDTAPGGAARGRALRRSLAIMAFALLATSAAASELLQRFIDPADGMFDMSEWLLDHKGFLPVPIVITEPAVGYGAGVALVFFRDAARRFEAAGDARGLAETALLQGHVQSDLGRLDEARALFDRAGTLWASLGDVRQQAVTLVADARVLARRGEYQVALEQFQAALARLEPVGDAIWQGSCLTGIALVSLWLTYVGSVNWQALRIAAPLSLVVLGVVGLTLSRNRE